MPDQEDAAKLRDEGSVSEPPSADPLKQRIDELFGEIDALKRSVERLERELEEASEIRSIDQACDKGGAQPS